MGKFVIKDTANGGFKFDLKAGNGEIIASSQIYKSEASCKAGIESVKVNALAPVEDQTVENFEVLKHPKYEVYTDKAGEFRFRLKAKNGEINSNILRTVRVNGREMLFEVRDGIVRIVIEEGEQ